MRRRLVVPVNAALLVCFTAWSSKSIGGDATWNQTSSGVYDWVSDANWNPALHPDSVGATARFTQALTGSQTIDLNEEITLGRLTLGTYGNLRGYTFETGASGSLVFDGAVVGGTAFLERTGLGTDVINAPVTLVDSLTANIGSNVSLLNAATTAGVFDFSTVRINGVISGGFTSTSNAIIKTGRGNLILAGDNTYTGRTLINQGALTVLHSNALGGDGTTVSASGAQLRIGGGITIGENITLASQAANIRQFSDGGLVSVGNNSLTGTLTLTANSRVYSNIGTLSLNNLALDVRQVIFNSGGNANGNVVLTGNVTGTSTAEIVKESGGTMVLNPADATGYAGLIRVNGGVLRVDSAADLGTRTGIDAIRFSNATLEVRSDSLSTDTGFANKGVTVDVNTVGTIFVDRAIGGTGVKQNITLADLQMNNRDITMNGRNGYSATFVDSADADTWVARMTETRTFTNNMNGVLTLQGDFLMDSTGTAKVVTAAATNANIILTGNFIQTAGTTVAHSLVKSGNATMIVQGTASQWTGTTSINAGTLEVSSLAALPTGAINIGTGTTAAGGTSAPALRYVGAGGTFASAIVLAGTTGNGRIDANGTGALTLSGNITSSGAGAKSLVLGGTNVGANTISGVISDNGGTNTTGLIKVGAGTWVLSGNNTYTGLTQVMNGTLRINANASVTSGLAATALTFAAVGTGENTILAPGQTAGGKFEYVGNAAGTTENLGVLTFAAGDGSVSLERTGGATVLVFSNLGARTSGATGNFVTSGGANGTDVFLRLTAGGTNATILNSGMYFGGADFAAYDTSNGGFIRGLAYGSDVGTAALNTVAAASHVKLTSSPASQASISLLTLNLSGAGTDFALNASGVLTLSTGGLIKSGGGSSSITGGAGASVTTGGATELVVRVDLSGETLTIGLPITGSTGGLTKSGEGTLILEGANTYTGTTTVNSGTVRLSGSGTLGAVANGLTTRQGGTVDLNGLNLGVGAFAGSGTISNAGALATLTIGNGNGAGLFTGLITGNLGVSKTGTGAIRFTGNNTYTGATVVNGGNLEIFTIANGGVSSGIGQSSNAASNLVLSNSGALGYYGETATTDRLFSLGTTGGRINSFTGAHLLGGTTTYQGALIFANTGAMGFEGSGSRLLTLGGGSSGDNEIRLAIGDNGGEVTSITKVDGGLWILSGSNTYTGATTINAGALRAVDGQGLSAGSGVVLNGGVLETDGTFNRAYGTGAGTVRFTLNVSGGFAAWRDKLVVNLDTNAYPFDVDQLIWADTLGTGALLLSSSTANYETEFQNHLELGGAQRTVTVGNNGFHTMDYATISGNISGEGAILAKNGTGLLVLSGSNSFTGPLWIQDGQVAVNTIGSTTGAVYATNVGAAGGDAPIASIRIGNGGTGATFIYTGSGEVTDRVFDMFGSTGAAVIESSGTGALVITSNLAVSTAGAKTLTLQGSTFDANEFRGIIGDSTSGATSLAKSGAGSWIVSGANTFTGGFTFNGNAGTLIFGHTQALGLGAKTLTFNDQTVLGALVDFAITSNQTVTQAGNILRLVGNKNFTFDGLFNITRTGDNTTFENFLEYGATTTFNNTITFSGDTTARTFAMTGNGTTYVNGLIRDTAGAADTFQIAGGILVLGGSVANTYGGTTQISNGSTFLRIMRSGATDPMGTAGVLQMDSGFFEAGVNLSGANAVKNQLRLNGTGGIVGAADVDFIAATTNSGGDRRLNSNLAAANRLQLSAINLSNDATNRTFTIGGFGATVISGVIANGGGSSASAFTYNGGLSGTLTIANGATANTYTGATIISGGTVILTNTSVDQFGTGTLQLNGGTTGGWLQSNVVGGSTIDNATLLNGGNTFSVNGAQNVTFTGVMTNNGGNRTLNSDITGGNRLTLAGAVNLSQDNTGRTLTIGGAGLTRITGAVVNGGSGAGVFVKAGSGTVTMLNDNTYTGATTVIGGELALDYSTNAATKLASGAALTLGSNTFPTITAVTNSNLGLANPTLRLSGNTSAVTETVNGLTLNQGAARIIVTPGSASLTLALGAITRGQTGATMDVAYGPGTAAVTTSNTLTNGILGGWLTVNGTDYAKLSGTTIVALAAGDYTTTNNVASWVTGTTNMTNNAAFTGTIGSSIAVNTVRFGAAAASTIDIGTNATLTITNGGLLVSSGVGANASNITGGYLDAGVGGELLIHQHNTAGDLTISSRIATGRVTKSGDGVLVLSGGNAYSGETVINEGTVRVVGGSGIGDYSTVTLRNDSTAKLQLQANETIGNLQGGGDVGGNVELGANTLRINQSAVTNYGGAFVGSGQIVVQGIGQLRSFAASAGFTGTLSLDGQQALLLQLMGDGVQNFVNASTINVKNASLLIDNNGSRPTDRIGNTAALKLDSARAQFGGIHTGLWVRTDQSSAAYNWNQAANTADYTNLITEDVGVLTLVAGDNYARMESTGGGVLRFRADSLVRGAGATFVVRGTNLGLGPNTGANPNTQRVIFGFTGTAPTGSLIGGAGAANTTTISVLPWGIGESVTGSIAATNRGNSFLTYDSVTGSLRPLNLTTEYSSNFDGLTTNVRFASTTASLSAIPGGNNSANVLVLDSSAGGTVTVTGEALRSLTLNAGGILSTSQGGTAATNIGGFSQILTNSSEYVVFTQGAHTLTVSSALATGGAGLVKAGEGRLILSANNSFGGATYVNDGVLELDGAIANSSSVTINGGSLVADVANALNDAATVNLAGSGTTYFVNESDTIGKLTGVADSRVTVAAGKILKVVDNTAGSTSLTTAVSGAGGFEKAGTTTLVLNGELQTSGDVIVSNGTMVLGSGQPYPEQIHDLASVTVQTGGTLDLNNISETIGSLAGVGGNVVLGSGTLTVGRNGLNGVYGGTISGSGGLIKVGAGSQTLSGTGSFTGPVLVRGGKLVLSGGSAVADGNDVTVSGYGATLELNTSETIRLLSVADGATVNLGSGAILTTTNTGAATIGGFITGQGGFTKNGAGVLSLGGTMTHNGATTINAGSVVVGVANKNANNVLSATSRLHFAAGTSLSFINTNQNIRGYYAVGSLTGGAATNNSINLVNGSNVSTLVVGADNTNFSFAGEIFGDNAETAVMKVGTGIWEITGGWDGSGNGYDGILRAEQGTIAVNTGAIGLDGSNKLVLSNQTGVKVTYSVGNATDTITDITGGGRVVGFTPYSLGGNAGNANYGGNYLGLTGGEIEINNVNTVLSVNSASPRVFGGVLSGIGTFAKTGAGVLDLWGANTISKIRVDGGFLRLGAFGQATGIGGLAASGTGSLSANTNLTVNAAGTFDLNGATQTLNTLTGSGVVSLQNGTLIFDHVNTSIVSTSGAFSGSIRGNGTLIVNGTTVNGWDLSGDNTFTGNLIVNGGLLRLNHTGVLSTGAVMDSVVVTVNSSGNMVVVIDEAIGALQGTGEVELQGRLTLTDGRGAVFAGILSGGGGLTLSGGSLTLNNANTYGGVTRIENGATIILDRGASGTDVVSNFADWELSGATVIVAGSSVGTEEKGNTVLTGGANRIAQSLGVNGVPNSGGTFALNAITRDSEKGATLLVEGATATTDTSNNSTGILGGYAVYNKNTWAVSDVAASDTLITGLANSAYTKTSTLGVTALTGVEHLDVDSNYTTPGGDGLFFADDAAATIRFNNAASRTLTIMSELTLTGSGILVTSNVGANDSFISGGRLGEAVSPSGGTNTLNELIVHQYNAKGDLIISSEIGGNLSMDLTKVGQGKLILLGDNSYGGTTFVHEGVLVVGNGGTQGTIAQTTDIVLGGVLDINKSNNISLAAIRSSNPGTSVPAYPRGWLRQLGSGVTELKFNNADFTGRISVRNGVLDVQHSSGLGRSGIESGQTTVEAGGKLRYSGIAGLTIAENIYLKGGTLEVATTGGLTSEQSGAVALIGATNNVTVASGETLRITGSILGLEDTSSAVGMQSAGVVFGGGGTVILEGTNLYYGPTTVDLGTTLRLGNNSAGGNLGRGDLALNGTMILDRTNATLYIGNKISGAGSINVNRTGVSNVDHRVYFTGDLTGATGRLNLLGTTGHTAVTLGNNSYIGSGVTPGFSGYDITGSSTGNVGVRISYMDNVQAIAADILMKPVNDSAGTNNRLSFFNKTGFGLLELSGKIAGEFASGSTDDRAFLQVVTGVMRIKTDQASGNYLMGLTGGNADGSKAFGGEISLAGNNSGAHAATNYGYFEIVGDANQTIFANITGGGDTNNGGIFVYNSTGTTVLTGNNTLFNDRNQINKGTVVFQGGNAWRNDGRISVGAGATLRVDTSETTNYSIMRGATLEVGTGVTFNNNGNTGAFIGGIVTGNGALQFNGNVTNRLHYENNTYSGGTILNRGSIQFTAGGSFGTGLINIDALATTEAEDNLLQYVGVKPGTQTVTNAITFNGSSTTRRTGLASYGVGQLIFSGPITLNRNAYLRGSATGISPNLAPFGNWTAGTPTISGLITGAGGIIKEDAGAWLLSNAGNTFTGSISLNNGRLETNSIGALGGTTKTFNLGSGGNSPSLVFTSAFTGGTLATTVEMNLSGTGGTTRIVNLGSGALTIADPTWTSTGAGSKTLALGRFDDTAGFVNVIQGAIVNNSGTNITSLVKDGMSTWRLNGVSTFTGSLTVNNGVLQLGNSAGTTLDNAVDVVLNNSTGRGATLELLFNETIDHLQGNVGSTVVLGANRLTIGANNGAATFNGVISGTGGVTKTGTGTMTFGAASSNVGLLQLGQNTYTGATRIEGGRIDTSTFANGGVASGFGASSNAASNLVLAGANNVSDIGIRYIGTGPASTDRLLTISGSDSATRTNNSIWASSSHVLGINDDAVVNFTNTGNIAFASANTVSTLTLRGNETGALLDHTFGLKLVDNGTAAFHLNKVELGLWVITNANTYTGTTTVSGGTLAITNNTALGSTTGGTTLSGASGSGLQLRGGLTITGETLTIATADASLVAKTGANVWTGGVVLSQNGRLSAATGASLDVSGVISGSGQLSIFDTGTVVLSGANTLSGQTNLAGGTLRLNYATATGSKLADGAALVFGGVNVATLAGVDDNNYTLSYQVGLSGGTLELSGGSHTEVVSATTINAGANRIIRTGGTSVVALNAITRAQGGTMDFGAASIATTDTNNTNGILGGWATVNKTDWAQSINTGAADTAITAFTGYAANTYTSASNTDVTTFGAVTAGFTTNSLRFNAAGGGTITLSGTNNLQSGGILMTANSGAVTIGGGAGVTLRSATSSSTANALDGLIIHNHSSNDLTIDVVIGQNVTGAGTQGITKTGDGKVILTQNNTFQGQVYITGGILQIGNGGTSGSLGTGGSSFNQIFIHKGATLLYNTTSTSEYNFQTLSGEGTLRLAATHSQPLLLDDDNANFVGSIILDGGILRVRGNNNALGSGRTTVIVNSGANLQAAGAGQTFGALITFNQGATLSAIFGNATNSTATFSGRLDFNNTTSAGMTVFTDLSQNLTISGIIKGSNGFTKTGDGTLTLSGQNFYDGAGTLSGQIIVSGGVLNLGNARALGSFGIGNETIVQSGASLDLREQDLNIGDDSSPLREIIHIAGSGYLGTGALRNTNSTSSGTVSIIKLDADASVGGSARIDMSAYDTDITAGNVAVRPTIEGNGHSLTKVGVGDFAVFEGEFSGLDELILSEGEFRAETRTQFPYVVNSLTTNPNGIGAPGVGGGATPLTAYPHTLLSHTTITGGVKVVYGGQTTDPNNVAILNAMVGARLEFYRQHGAHHTAAITAFGRSAASGGNFSTTSYIELNSDTLSKTYTFYDGSITLTGLADGSNTFFNIEGGGAGTNLGDGILGTQSPAGDQVVNAQSMLIIQGAITGSGGFTKLGSRELRLTGNNTYTGDTVLTRLTGTSQPIDPDQADEARVDLFGTTLYGQGTMANTANLVFERRGVLRVDNTSDLDGANITSTPGGFGNTNIGANLSNRINDNATLRMREGYLVFDSGSTNVTETLGTVRAEIGQNYITVNPKNGSNADTQITISKIERLAGSTLVLSSWDSTATFGLTDAAADDSVRFRLLDSSGLSFSGAANTQTNKAVAKGLFGGLAPLANDEAHLWGNGQASAQSRNNQLFSGRHFMTLDGGYLRPLDDSEYYTNTANMAGAAGQNLNLSLPATMLMENLTVNSLRFGNLDDNLNNNAPGSTVPGTRMVGWQQFTPTLVIDDNATLNITSGMILSANMGQGVNQDMQTYINGGTINFGDKEGLIVNVNGWYNTSSGTYAGNAMFIRSTIAGTVAANEVGITKAGFQEVFFDGRNTYSGITKVTNGSLSLRHDQALGQGGTGHGVVVEGSGQITIRAGINIGHKNGNLNASREDIYVGTLAIDNQNVISNIDSVNRWYGNITFDNISNGGQTVNATIDPRILIGGNSTLVMAGNLGGGNTAVTNDTYYINPRQWTLDGGSNGWLILQGTVGDKLDANGNAISVNGPISNKPTGTVIGGTTYTNENEVLVSWLGGSDEMNVEAQQQWKAVGRIELMRGFLRYTGDGSFYDANTLDLINRSEAGNGFVGFQIGGSNYKTDPGDNSMVNFLLTKAGQSLGVNNFTITTHANANNGAVMIGGENESGVVTFGAITTATNSTIALGRDVRLYANAGGTVEFNSRFTGGSISKVGRGIVSLNGSVVGASTTASFLISGGTLKLDYTTQNNVRFADSGASNFNGGTFQVVGNTAANTTQGFTNVNNGALNLRPGATEILVESSAGRTTTLNLGRRASATDGANINRTAGSTINFVEANNGGTSAITLAAKSSNWVTNVLLGGWATYSNTARQAADFAMINATGNAIQGLTRVASETQNDVSNWRSTLETGANVTENGTGFTGSLGTGSNLTINSLRFDTASDNAIGLGTTTLNVSSGGILVSSNVGQFNKTIYGGVLTTVNDGELYLHHYGQNRLTIASQIGAASLAPSVVVVTGPSVTGAASLANWANEGARQVILTADNSVAGKEMKWHLTGSVLSVSNMNQLGKVDFAAATNDAIYMNGGAFRWTGGTADLDNERNVTIGGNGGVIDIVDGDAVFTIKGNIISENNYAYVNGSANAGSFVGGDLIKMGAGTLGIEGESAANGSFTGMIDVREGTLRLNGDNTAATSGTQTIAILGTNRSFLDGTVFRQGTNFEVYLGAAGGGVEWRIEEWLRFEGNNTMRIGQTPVAGVTNRTTHINGVIDVQGTLTVDVAAGLTARFNQSSGGYLTGTGDIIKSGQGVLEFRDNNLLWSGALKVEEGVMRLISTGMVAGVGTQAITLGANNRQGVAEIQMYWEQGIPGAVHEVFQDINVIYNPLQTKRITAVAETAAGLEAYFHGDITLSDNLGLYTQQPSRLSGGTYSFMYFTGGFKDDLINGRSGNLSLHVDDTNNGTANNQQVGEGIGYFVFRGDNSGWSGDVILGLNQSWDQDEQVVLRLENDKALTELNDVTMNGSSKLQVAGSNVTIGSLHTNNGPLGTTTPGSGNDGLGNFQGVVGSSAFIENASTTEGTLTVTQTTPSNTEALWDVHFRNGTLPNHLISNNTAVSAALHVVKAGNGWATMTLDNDYTGTTTVKAGVLQIGRGGVGDTGAANAQGTIVKGGATVAGTGFVQGGLTLELNGLLKPGDNAGSSMGTLTINGNTLLGTGSVTQLQIQRATYNNSSYLDYRDTDYASWVAGITTDEFSHALSDPVLANQHDKLVVNGTLTWTAGTKIEVVNNGYTATAGDVFNLIDWFAVSGGINTGSAIYAGGISWNDLVLPELGNGFRWDTSLFNSQGILLVVAPEPSRALLLMLGFALLFMRRRRR